jgi:hypothetical protein
MGCKCLVGFPHYESTQSLFVLSADPDEGSHFGATGTDCANYARAQDEME